MLCGEDRFGLVLPSARNRGVCACDPSGLPAAAQCRGGRRGIDLAKDQTPVNRLHAESSSLGLDDDRSRTHVVEIYIQGSLGDVRGRCPSVSDYNFEGKDL